MHAERRRSIAPRAEVHMVGSEPQISWRIEPAAGIRVDAARWSLLQRPDVGMAENHQVEIRGLCQPVERNRTQSGTAILGSCGAARVRAADREGRREVGVQPSKGRDREAVPQDAAERVIAPVLVVAKSVAVLDQRPPSRKRPAPRSDVILDADIASQDLAAPTIMVAGNPQDVDPTLPQIRQRGERPERGTRNDGAPLEPEIEQVAVDHERSRIVPDVREKGEQRAFDRRIGGAECRIKRAEVRIRDDVAG